MRVSGVVHRIAEVTYLREGVIEVVRRRQERRAREARAEERRVRLPVVCDHVHKHRPSARRLAPDRDLRLVSAKFVYLIGD